MSVTHIITCNNVCIITEKWFKLNCIGYKVTQYMFGTTYTFILYMTYMA